MLDPFFLGSARYAAGVLLFIGILWIAEGRQALRYGGRFLPGDLLVFFGAALVIGALAANNLNLRRSQPQP